MLCVGSTWRLWKHLESIASGIKAVNSSIDVAGILQAYRIFQSRRTDITGIWGVHSGIFCVGGTWQLWKHTWSQLPFEEKQTIGQGRRHRGCLGEPRIPASPNTLFGTPVWIRRISTGAGPPRTHTGSLIRLTCRCWPHIHILWQRSCYPVKERIFVKTLTSWFVIRSY